MKKIIVIIIQLLMLSSCINKKGISITWTENLEGDYSFSQEWEYTDFVYQNEFGQLICDGICNPATDKMRDCQGRILTDSLTRYYQLVDTTHLHKTTQSTAICLECGEIDHIEVFKTNDGKVWAYTLQNISTHTVFEMELDGKAYIKARLNSITSTEDLQYSVCQNGWIKIDKQLFDKDTLKAEFDLHFENNISWKGKILAPIE